MKHESLVSLESRFQSREMTFPLYQEYRYSRLHAKHMHRQVRHTCRFRSRRGQPEILVFCCLSGSLGRSHTIAIVSAYHGILRAYVSHWKRMKPEAASRRPGLVEQPVLQLRLQSVICVTALDSSAPKRRRCPELCWEKALQSSSTVFNKFERRAVIQR